MLRVVVCRERRSGPNQARCVMSSGYGMVAKGGSEMTKTDGPAGPLLDMAEVAQRLSSRDHSGSMLGFDRVMTIEGSTYRDQSTVVIMPSRDPKIHYRVVTALHGMIAPMNQKRAIMFCVGDEVGIAYNTLVASILAHPDLSKWKYVMTIEADNLVPHDAHKRLLESIEFGKYDGVSGLYFTKGEINMPMAYGDPARFAATGELEFGVRNVVDALKAGQVMDVNGIAMGCALFRMDLFRQIKPPWFMTVDDVIDGRPVGFTQDLYFCKQARMAGHRFAVDCRVKVGHLDLATGEVY